MSGNLGITYTVRSRSGVSETRVLADGRVQERAGAGRWRKLTTLGPAALAELATVVETTGFWGWPNEIHLERDVADGSVLVWDIQREGRRHSVSLRHGGGPVRHGGFAALDEALQRLIGEALDAESEG